MWKKKTKEEDKRKVKTQDVRLSQEAKNWFEEQLLELNLELSRLRSLHAELENKYEVEKKELESGVEDKGDVILYLKRVIAERDEELVGLKAEKKTKEKKKSDITEKYVNQIQEKEMEVVSMIDTLSKEKLTVEYKLFSMKPLQKVRVELLTLIGAQEGKIDDQRERHKWEIYDLETKQIIERHNQQKDIEQHIEDFMAALEKESPLRLAGTENDLVKQNVCLNNLLESHLESFFKVNETNNKLLSRFNKLRDINEYKALETSTIVQVYNSQQHILTTLIKEYELSKDIEIGNIAESVKILYQLMDMVQKEAKLAKIFMQLLNNAKLEYKRVMDQETELKKQRQNIESIYKNAIKVCTNLLRKSHTSVAEFEKLKEYLRHTEEKQRESIFFIHGEEELRKNIKVQTSQKLFERFSRGHSLAGRFTRRPSSFEDIEEEFQ